MSGLGNLNSFSEQDIDSVTLKQIHHYAGAILENFDDWMNGMNMCAPSTIRAHLAAISAFLRWIGLDLPGHIRRPKAERRLPKTLSDGEVAALVLASDGSSNRLDKILIRLLLDTGLRVSEVCDLDIYDVDISARNLRVRGGKGDKDRTVLFTVKCAQEIVEWINQHRPKPTNPSDPAALLLNSRGARIHPRGVQRTMDRLARRASIDTRRLTPHVLRHTFATGLLRRGADIVSIQRLLGHADLTTTRVYLDITDTALREIYDRSQQIPDNPDQYYTPLPIKQEASFSRQN